MARTVTKEHKAAMQRGGQRSSRVDAYFKAVGQPKKRGRQVRVEDFQRRCAEAGLEAGNSDGVARLKALPKTADLQARIGATTAAETIDIDALEKAFGKVAAESSEAQGITYSTWREAGVRQTS